jgi:hypothetical protein
VRAGSRCGFAAFYGLDSDPLALAAPIPPGVGPAGYGRSHRGCQDCNGCAAWLAECPRANVSVEFVGLEFARDVCYPTAYGGTTQESVVRGHLAALAEPPYAVVVSSGLHDLAVPPVPGVAPAAVYEGNVRWLAALLNGSLTARGTRLLWVATAAVRSARQPPQWRNITSSARVREFNAAAARAVAAVGIPLLDVFPVSTLPFVQELSRDGVHLGLDSEFYYSYVAAEIVKHVCEPPPP